MSIVVPKFKQSVIDVIEKSLQANTVRYYAFAANPVEYQGSIPNNTYDTANAALIAGQTMMFGKKLSNNNIAPMINNTPWAANTVFAMYDHTNTSISNSNFYCITPPSEVSGTYNVFKCLYNNNNSRSTEIPDQLQPSSFTKSDGYIWRYMYSISTTNYNKFATPLYAPVFPNTTIVNTAYQYSGVDVVVVSNNGSGYIAYHDGTVKSVANSTLLQIENTAQPTLNYYTNNAIYIYNNTSSTAQLKTIQLYIANSSGNWVYLNSSANTNNILAGVTQYKIVPQVKFNTDGDTQPAGYAVVNTQSNTIQSVVIVEPGYGITRAQANIITSSVAPPTVTANIYCVIPPPGGHGSDCGSELFTKAIGVNFTFANTESNTIPLDVTYNKIGIIENPYALNANNTKGSQYTSVTFNSVLKASVSPSATFTAGEVVTGNTSQAKAYVVFSNSSTVYLTGDKQFSNNEYIVSANGDISTQMTINTLGDIYTKDIVPVHIQNTDNIERANGQYETFKIIIQV